MEPERSAAAAAGAPLPSVTLLLEATVTRLREATGRERVLAWARGGSRPHLAAATYRGDPPLEPEAGEFAALAGLRTAVDLCDPQARRELRALAARHGCGAAAAVPGDTAVLLLGGGAPGPRTRAALEAAAARLEVPLSAALRVEHADAELCRLDRLAALGSLTQEIAHEIRSPLTSLRTFLQLLPERHRDPDFLERFGGIVGQELERLERLLDLLIGHGRPARREGEPRAVVAEVLAGVGPILRHRAACSGLVLTLGECCESLAVGLGGDALRQVLFNLAGNAIEATPRGGRVEIAVTAAAGLASLHVRDSGPGIPPQRREALFEPFASGRGERPGGLGLAITRRLVEEAGGRIEILDAAAGGAELCVTLPIARERPSPPD